MLVFLVTAAGRLPQKARGLFFLPCMNTGEDAGTQIRALDLSVAAMTAQDGESHLCLFKPQRMGFSSHRGWCMCARRISGAGYQSVTPHTPCVQLHRVEYLFFFKYKPRSSDTSKLVGQQPCDDLVHHACDSLKSFVGSKHFLVLFKKKISLFRGHKESLSGTPE